MVRTLRKTILFSVFVLLFIPVLAQRTPGAFSNIQLDSNIAMSKAGHNLRVSSSAIQKASGYPAIKRTTPIDPIISASQQRTICFDTSERFFMGSDTVTFYTSNPTMTADGHVLIAGEYAVKNMYSRYRGFLMKTDSKGNLDWLHILDSAQSVRNYQFINFQRILELKDGSIFLAGRTNGTQGENDLIIFVKTDSNGNLIWTRQYRATIWTHGNGSMDYWVPYDMKEDQKTGEIYVSNAYWAIGRGLLKLDASNGNILWSKSYDVSGSFSFDTPLGIDVRDDEVRYFGKFLNYSTSEISVLRINKATGDTIGTRFFAISDPQANYLGILSAGSAVILSNGNYVLSGSAYGSYKYNYDGKTDLYQGSAVEFDRDLNFVKATAFANRVMGNMSNNRVTPFRDGSILFSMLEFFSGYTANIYYVQTQNGKIVRQRRKHYQGEGVPYEPAAFQLPDGGNMLVRLMGDSATSSSHVEFFKIHVSDTASNCLGYDDNASTLYPFKYSESFRYILQPLSDIVVDAGPIRLFSADRNTERSPACFSVSYCDSIRLKASATQICVSQPLQVFIRKNIACGATVPLFLDTSALQDATRLNDSTMSLKFKKPWSGYIVGSLQGCSLLKDSVLVNVLQSPTSLDLGTDRTLCEGNQILLNAKSGYAEYKWQDNSTDSIFTVLRPGTFYVTTKDACGSTFTDTVNVTAAPPVPFDAGGDRTKCNTDTIQLRAQGGFINYVWSNDNNTTTTTGASVIVAPSVNTRYFIKAEKTQGCFAFDTVQVTVNHSPQISLGADKSFCSGDSVRFDAGPGFTAWHWSTGQVQQAITVKTAGAYSVHATTIDGCASDDTIRVINVFPLPTVSLDQNQGLCTGASRVLDAGNFAGYQWNNGAQTKSIQVNDTGTYSVTVTDLNGCAGAASTNITIMYPVPHEFLPGDTALCSYSKMLLKPSSNYQSYQWNTGSTAPAVTVNQPGKYWLMVKDEHDCSGKDSILIALKDCMEGCYIPTAFTPNGDGRNDVFRALLFGNVVKFEFRIFNRWGQVVYQSQDWHKGWDGKVSGILQNGLFVWQCIYQLEGAAEVQKRGTVNVIR